jgi:hypothetical protein
MFLAAATIAGGLALAGTAPAMAQPSGFSFRVGDVAFGYTDGYYDNNRAWHAWSARERNWYRSHYRRNYRAMRHDRDHDGIADRFDRRPNNPYRH